MWKNLTHVAVGISWSKSATLYRHRLGTLLVKAKNADEKQTLESNLKTTKLEQNVAITQAVSQVEKERDQLKGAIDQAKLKQQLEQTSLKEKYETQIKDRDEAIERLRDMKARMSTKMVGETLEQHCDTEFNRIRATAFPNAYFEKDNDAKSGSKGDFILSKRLSYAEE